MTPAELTSNPYGKRASVDLSPYARLRIDKVPGSDTIIVSAMRYPHPKSLTELSKPRTDEERAALSALVQKAKFRRKVCEVGIANDFEITATFTFSERIGNDIDAVKEFVQWMRTHSRTHNYKMHYMYVLAPGKNGGHWHYHMLISGIPEEELVALTPESDGLAGNQRKRIMRGLKLYHWAPFAAKYHSYHEIQRIGDTDKYGHPVGQLGKTIYMSRQYNDVPAEHFPSPRTRKFGCSRDCKRPSDVSRGYIDADVAGDLLKSYGIEMDYWGTRAIMTGAQADKFLKEFWRTPTWIEDNDLLPPHL